MAWPLNSMCTIREQLGIVTRALREIGVNIGLQKHCHILTAICSLSNRRRLWTVGISDEGRLLPLVDNLFKSPSSGSLATHHAVSMSYEPHHKPRTIPN